MAVASFVLGDEWRLLDIGEPFCRHGDAEVVSIAIVAVVGSSFDIAWPLRELAALFSG